MARELGIGVEELFDIVVKNNYMNHTSSLGDYLEIIVTSGDFKYKLYVDGHHMTRGSNYFKIGQKFKLGYADPLYYQEHNVRVPLDGGYNYGFSIISTRNKYLIRIRTTSKAGLDHLKNLYYK